MGDERAMPHKIQLSERKFLSMTGVSEVISFDETVVVLRTALGLLTVHGQDLQLKMLALEGGEVAVEGLVTAFIYEEARPSGGVLRRLFG